MGPIIATVAVATLGIIVTVITANWRQSIKMEHRFTTLEVKITPLAEVPGRVTTLEVRHEGLAKEVEDLKGRVDRMPRMAVQ